MMEDKLTDFRVTTSALKRVQFLAELPPDALFKLLDQAMLIELKNQSILFSQGEPAEAFFVVLSGVLKLIRENGPGTTLLDLVAPSEMIGGLLMQEGVIFNYPISAVSVGDSEVLRIPREIFLGTWAESSVVGHVVQSQIEARKATLHNRCSHRLSIEQRLACILLEAPSVRGIVSIDERKIADQIGAACKSVRNIFKVWEQQGLLTRSFDGVKLLKPMEIYHLWHAQP